jgi:hypothetical protein
LRQPHPNRYDQGDQTHATRDKPMGMLKKNNGRSGHARPWIDKHIVPKCGGPIRHRHASNLGRHLPTKSDEKQDGANKKTRGPENESGSLT